MTWSRGRLMSANYGGNITFAYDHNGLRTEKNSSQGNYSYYYSGTQLVKMTDGTNTGYFYYGADGRPYAVKFNGTVFYYTLNRQKTATIRTV